MADVSKLKRSRLGIPPSTDEASGNLSAPEVAPVRPVTADATAVSTKYDARSARRTNRTQQFATRVTPEWDHRIRQIAQAQGMMLTEVLELALLAYEKEIAGR